MCPAPSVAPGLFALPPPQFVPAWVVIALLGGAILVPLAVAFRAVRLFQGLARGQEQWSLVWLEIFLGVFLAIFYSLFAVFLLWTITLVLWESTIDYQCVKQFSPLLLLAHPGNVVGMIVFVLAGIGMWASQQWYRRTKRRLDAGQPFREAHAK